MFKRLQYVPRRYLIARIAQGMGSRMDSCAEEMVISREPDATASGHALCCDSDERVAPESIRDEAIFASGKRGIEPEETHRSGGNRVPDQGGGKSKGAKG